MIKTGLPVLYEYDDVESNLKLCQELGIDFVEINLNFGYVRKALENHEIAPLLKKYPGIELTCHFYDETDMASYQEVVDAYMVHLERYATLAEGLIVSMNMHLNPGPVVTISGVKNYIYEKEYDEYIERLIRNFHTAEKILNKHNIKMVIENTDNLPEYCKRAYADLYKEGFKFCYDIGHDHLSYDLVWDVLQNHDLQFGEFHVHDAKDRKKCHLALGDGVLDIAKFKRLAEKNNAYALLEVKSSDDLKKSVPIWKEL